MARRRKQTTAPATGKRCRVASSRKLDAQETQRGAAPAVFACLCVVVNGPSAGTDNHPSTANSYSNLAYNFHRQKDFASAEKLYEKALEVYRRLQYDDHPQMATTYANLGYTSATKVTYAPSATVLEYLRDQPRAKPNAGLLALGDPDFASSGESRSPEPSGGDGRLLAAARGGDEAFAPLPGTRREVEVLAQLFKSADRSTIILLGPDASEPQLARLASSRELGRFGFIHLATHGVIDEAIPGLAGGQGMGA